MKGVGQCIGQQAFGLGGFAAARRGQRIGDQGQVLAHREATGRGAGYRGAQYAQRGGAIVLQQREHADLVLERGTVHGIVRVQGMRCTLHMPPCRGRVHHGERNDHVQQLDAGALRRHRGLRLHHYQGLLGILEGGVGLTEQGLHQDSDAPPAHSRSGRRQRLRAQRVDAKHDALQPVDMAAPQRMKCQ